MNYAKTTKKPSEEKLTLIVEKSTKNRFIAKLLILLSLSLVGGYFFARDGVQSYEKGLQLTEEKYLEKFDEHKSQLLSSKEYSNPVLSTFVMLMMVSFLIGSYELTALVIGLIIGKVIKQ